MGIELWLTPCQLFFDKKGKDGCRYIVFSKPNEDNVILSLYSILKQDQVQENYEGCIVTKVEIGTKEVLDINLSIEDFK